MPAKICFFFCSQATFRALAAGLIVWLAAVVVVAVTLLLFRFEAMGLVYLVAAVGLGAAFMWQAFGLKRDATRKRAMRLFAFSNAYLALLFAAIAVDTLVRAR